MTYSTLLQQPGTPVLWSQSQSLRWALYGLGTAPAGEYSIEDEEGRVAASVTVYERNGKRSLA